MIVYFLGAGASYDTLPVVKDFPERLRGRAETMHERARFLDSSMSLFSGKSPEVILSEFTKSLKWLASETAKHLSVDTLAKKYCVSGNDSDLHRLRATLSCFIWLEQVLRPTQIRYDAFIAAIVSLDKQHNVKLPSEVKIITWNYDSQVERAFFPYFGKSTGLYDALQAYPVNYQRKADIDPRKFCIVRLNGIAGLHLFEETKIGRPNQLFSILRQEEAMTPLVEMFDRYLYDQKNIVPLLNFAWEENAYTSTYRPMAIAVAGTAIELVVIGYSFPFFNRNIDRELLDAMGNLERIYIQVPTEAFPEVRDRIRSARPDIMHIDHIQDLSQFYLPRRL